MQEDGCVMAKPRERNYEPVTVPFAVTPAGEPPSIRGWANPCVWTDRMLTTLEQGVRGGRWHTLIDKVYAPLNLFAASASVIGNRGAAGVDHQTVESFDANRRKELDRLHESLRTDSYADDFVILCKTREDADRALEAVQRWVAENDLTLHPTKTKIVDAGAEGFDFLGYQFRGKLRLPRDKSLKKFKDAVRNKTKRANGLSMLFLCARLSLQLRGWFAYFRHCHWHIFRDLDGWIRGRLRSILRKRQHRRGRARTMDQQQWPNRFFDELGLYSLNKAHVHFVQSSQR